MSARFEVWDRHVALPEDKNAQLNAHIETFVQALEAKNQSHEYYSRMRNAVKASQDNFLGKKAEMLVALAMIRYYQFPRVFPDLTVYTSGKSWEADLPYANVDSQFQNVHVKACSRATREYAGDYTWTFQYGNLHGRGGRDALFSRVDSEDLIALVYLENPMSASADIKAILPWRDLVPLLSEPKKPTLVGLKKCLYMETLRNAFLHQ